MVALVNDASYLFLTPDTVLPQQRLKEAAGINWSSTDIG